MDKTLFKDFKIQQSFFEFKFEPVPDIERKANDFDSKLKSIFEENFIFTKVPDKAPFNIPRFVLKGKHSRLLEVSLVNAVFKANMGNIENSKAISLIQDKVKTVFNYLKSIDFKIEGLVSTHIIHYPIKEIQCPLNDILFDSFFKIKRANDFTGASFSIVRKTDDYKFHNSLDVYETREILIDVKKEAEKHKEKISIGNSRFFRIPESEMQITEKGLLNKIVILFDENNLKNKDVSSDEMFNKILNVTIDKIMNHANEFIFGVKDAG